MVYRPEDLESINPSTNVVRIGHTVGENKRNRIIEAAKKKNLRILNHRAKRETEEAKAAEEPVEVNANEGSEAALSKTDGKASEDAQ